MEKGQKFEIELDGVKTEAELLDVVIYNDERYALYFTENDDSTSDLYAAKVVSNAQGEDELVDILDKEVKNYLLKLIHDTINR